MVKNGNASIEILKGRGWENTARNHYQHVDHEGHIITVNKAGGWCHSVRYSTGYKILAQSHGSEALVAHLTNSKSLNGVRA